MAFRWFVVGLVAFGITAFFYVPNAIAETLDSSSVSPDSAYSEPGPVLVADQSTESLPIEVGSAEVTISDEPAEEIMLAQSSEDQPVLAQGRPSEEIEEYDPWEPFNDPMFTFNYKLDQYVMRPIAQGYDKVVPDQVKQALDRAFTNLGFVPRAVNSSLQLKFVGTVREVARFVINSTLGIAGLFDVAKNAFGIEKSNEDMGQTLAVWGIGNGPYLVLPFLSPSTVRDTFGKLIDAVLDPISFFLPILARLGITVTDIVNDRSLNLDLFEDVERATLDLYTAVRNAYLQRRAKAIRE